MASLSSGENLILNGRNQGTSHGDQVSSWFNLQFQFTSIFGSKFLKGFSDRLANFLQISGWFSLVTADLVTSSQVECFDGIPNLAKGKRFDSNLLPNGWLTSRSNVRVDSFDGQTVLFDNGGNRAVVDQGVPNSKGRGWSSNIGFGKGSSGFGETAGSDTRVDTDSNLLASSLKGLAETFQLGNRAGIDLDSHLDQIDKIGRKLLGTETNVLGGNTSAHGALDFVSRRGINVNILGIEEFEDRRVGAGLHGVTDGQSIGVGEGEASIGGLFELFQRISVERAATGNINTGGGGFGSQEGRLFRVGHVERTSRTAAGRCRCEGACAGRKDR
mmetsp:Transcript_29588/g.71209  ORF Transcript_29588/g.71209 Transcript_29588/m.71209 type:complete len:330 (-) Transcript_29588:300-1289(-)